MANLPEKANFLKELSVSLHTYGVPAHRIETYIDLMGKRLGLEEVQVLSLPTSIMLSVQDSRKVVNRMVRVRPGGMDLSKLKEVDQICGSLRSDEIRLSEGMQKLREVHERPPLYSQRVLMVSFAITAIALNVIFGATVESLVFSPLVGLLTALVFYGFCNSEKLQAVAEVGAAITASLTTYIVGTIWLPMNIISVILSALIILIPGLTITTAILELATENLVSGTSRMMQAMTVLMKLFFGYIVGKTFAQLALRQFSFPELTGVELLQLPIWVDALSLSVLAICFITLFQMRFSDYPWVLLICLISFGTNQFVFNATESNLSVFVAAFAVSVSSHIYARWTKAPASTVLLPGMLLLVPGTIGYRGLLEIGEKQILSGIDLGFQMIFISTLIVGGLLIGHFVLPPKQTL